jgi:hypothetical protein
MANVESNIGIIQQFNIILASMLTSLELASSLQAVRQSTDVSCYDASLSF